MWTPVDYFCRAVWLLGISNFDHFVHSFLLLSLNLLKSLSWIVWMIKNRFYFVILDKSVHLYLWILLLVELCSIRPSIFPFWVSFITGHGSCLDFACTYINIYVTFADVVLHRSQKLEHLRIGAKLFSLQNLTRPSPGGKKCKLKGPGAAWPGWAQRL